MCTARVMLLLKRKKKILIWERIYMETLNPLHVRVQETLIPHQTLNVPLLTHTRLKAIDFDAKQNGVELGGCGVGVGVLSTN
jgi:hypothetical protein